MDDSARGMATQILRDMLNIGGTRERSAESRESVQEDQQAEDSASETTSITSSLSSPPKPQQALSDTSFSDASGLSISLEPVKQVIQLGEGNNGSVCIYGNQVEILESEDSQGCDNPSSSNKIKFNPMVNYDWDLKYYKGNLLACGSKFIAYALKGRNGYVVRILNPQTATRALIKGFSGRICDLAFAHANSSVLACIDEGGKVYVWNISENYGKIEHEVKLHMGWTSSGGLSDNHHLCWCPFIPEEEDSECGGDSGGDVARLLAVTHDDQAEVIDVEAVASRCRGAEIPIKTAREGGGFVAVKDGHTKAITDIALSPDGAVLTTASDDGYVKFWKLAEDPAVCIHEFKPHDGAPVSCLKFCDNYVSQDDEVPMWRFLITGTQLNRELKVWCTVNWTCLQTVCSVPQPALVACLDPTASYLVLSDITKKVLYVLLLHQNLAEGRAHFTSVSEFPLNQPVLSFVVTEAKSFRVGQRDEHSPHENGETYGAPDKTDDEPVGVHGTRRTFGVQLQLCGILTKSMQQLVIQFQPEPSVQPPTVSALSSLSTLTSEPAVRDALSDFSGMDTGTEASTDADEPDGGSDGARRITLVTPDAFTSPQPRPDSTNSSVTSVSSLLSQSQRSADDLLNSSCSSRLSNSTLRSSGQDHTPHASLEADSFVLTPTSVPFPVSPPAHSAPDPSAVPIPTFASPLETSAQHDSERPQAGVSGLASGAAATEQDDEFAVGGPAQPPGKAGEVDVILEDEAKEDEDLPEAQKPGAEAQDEDSSARSGLLIDLAFQEPVRETHSAGPLEAAEAGANGRESPESADAILVAGTSPLVREVDRAWAQPDLAPSPVALVDIPPETRRSPQGQQASADWPVLSKLSEMLGLLQSQERQIEELRQQLTDQRTQHRHELATLVHQEVHALGEGLADRVHKSLAEYSREETQRMEKFIRDKQSSEKKRHEQLQSALSQTLTSSLTGKLDKTVKAEIKAATGPAVQKFLASLQEQLNGTMTQKLTAADSVLKDSIGKMVRSKGVVDAIGTAASTALQGPIQVTYTEAFKNTVLPAFERSCQVMFQQINTAFQAGTQQYMQQLMSSLEAHRTEHHERQEPVTQQLQAQAHALQQLPEAVCSAVSGQVDAMLRSQLHGLREELVSIVESQVTSAVQDVVRAEVSAGLQDIRDQLSDNPTPTPTDCAHQQMTIASCMDAGEVEEAFKVALSAGDLSLVVYACSRVDPTELFGTRQLSPPVLLSLIQQLSCDLTSDTTIKVKFLEEALMNLDDGDEITQKHVPSVLQGLCQQLREASKEALPSGTQRSLKMLLMAANSLR